MSLFITLEGPEGTGKSTQAKLLARRLRREGYDALLTREPGGTRIGRRIREVLLAPDHRAMCAEAELGLYFSDRAQHLREVIWPALASGKIVVSDRFTDSTFAYQGYGRRLSLPLIRRLDRIMTGSFRPDVTVLLDLAAEAGLSRARRRNRGSVSHRKEGRFEIEALAFHERVRRGYLALARKEPRRFLLLSAEGSPAKVHEAVWARLLESGRLPRRPRS
ncbi:MAG TPA: dTMP kinase [Vicinamibacteria bacterium]|nr:dTMP kinase [Vicinamibacteria bacterium]